MKKLIIASFLMFSSYFLIGQNLVDLECIENKDSKSSTICKWYVTNNNDKSVEVIIGKKLTGCDNQISKEGTLTKTISPNKRTYIGRKEKNTCQNKTADYGYKYTIISTKFIEKR